MGLVREWGHSYLPREDVEHAVANTLENGDEMCAMEGWSLVIWPPKP